MNDEQRYDAQREADENLEGRAYDELLCEFTNAIRKDPGEPITLDCQPHHPAPVGEIVFERICEQRMFELLRIAAEGAKAVPAVQKRLDDLLHSIAAEFAEKHLDLRVEKLSYNAGDGEDD